jgi:hypothetical protein
MAKKLVRSTPDFTSRLPILFLKPCILWWVGKLANTVDEFAQHLLFLITNPQETAKLQKNARDSVFRFSDEEFSSKCLECLEKILKKN